MHKLKPAVADPSMAELVELARSGAPEQALNIAKLLGEKAAIARMLDRLKQTSSVWE